MTQTQLHRKQVALPLEILPAGGLVVGVPDFPVYHSQFALDEADSHFMHLAARTLNMTAAVPVSGARYALVYLLNYYDQNPYLETKLGAIVANKAALTWDDIPGWEETDTGVTAPLAAVALEAGQTTISEGDIIDLRFLGLATHGNIARLAYNALGGATDSLVAWAGDNGLYVTSKNLSDLLHANGSVLADYLTFDTTPSGTPTAEGTLVWNTDRETLDLIMSNGVRYQTGQELFFYAINQTGSAIADGACVMFDGSLGVSGIIKCKLAVADGTYPSIYIMGIATEAIANGETGRITFFGEVHGYNTSGYAAGDLLYPDPANPGGLTNAAPVAPNLKYSIAVALNSKNNGTILVRAIYTMGLAELDDATISAPAEGDILQHVGGVWKNKPVFADTYAPTGWQAEQAWNKATVAVVSATKLKITISAADNLTWYWRGVKTLHGATSLEVTSTADKAEGIWYCYSTDGTNFVLNQTPFYIFDLISGSIRSDLMIWEFYWDNTNNTTLWIQPEFHANTWNRSIHGYAHETLGTRYANGLDMTYGSTYANNDTRVKITDGEIHDEDISAYIVNKAAPAAIWEQILNGAGTTDADFAALPIYYLSGATPVWRKTATSSYPFLPVSNNYIYYNRLNAGSWDYTTSIGSSNFVVYWLVATTNQSEPLVIIPGRIDHASLSSAQAEAAPSLLTLFTEYKVLYRLIYQTAGAGNTNNGKCKIASVTDYRRDAISNNAGSMSVVSAALVSFTPTGNIAATNVQAAIEELDTEKVPTSRAITATAPLTIAGSSGTPVDLSADRTIAHSTAAGYIHLPAAGATTQILQWSSAGTAKWVTLSADITIADNGAITIANSAVALAKMANMATASVFYRKTAGSGAPEVQTLATLKTDLGLTGTNSGDQVVPANEAGATDQRLTAYNSTTGAWTKGKETHEFPFAGYTSALPLSANGNPYSLAVGKAFTAAEFVTAFYVVTTNNSSNYWTIEVLDLAVNSCLSFTTKDASEAANTWYRKSITSFSFTDISVARIGVYVKATKTGSPGSLYLLEPKFVGTYA